MLGGPLTPPGFCSLEHSLLQTARAGASWLVAGPHAPSATRLQTSSSPSRELGSHAHRPACAVRTKSLSITSSRATKVIPEPPISEPCLLSGAARGQGTAGSSGTGSVSPQHLARAAGFLHSGKSCPVPKVGYPAIQHRNRALPARVPSTRQDKAPHRIPRTPPGRQISSFFLSISVAILNLNRWQVRPAEVKKPF